MATSSHQTDYIDRLKQAENTGDWSVALEIVTESRVLKKSLSHEELESAARSFSNGKQWARAIELLQSVESPSESTTLVLFQSLAVGGQGKQAMEILSKLEGQQQAQSPAAGEGDFPPSPLSPLYNLTIRALAKEGDLDQALKLMEKMAMSNGRYQVDPGIFNLMANEFIIAGRHDDAELVLDFRDYF